MEERKTNHAPDEMRRLAVAVCLGVIGACGTYVLVEAVARISDGLAFLLQPMMQFGFAIGIGLGVLVLGAYRLPKRVWKGWLGLALLAIPPLSCAALIAPVTLHDRLGTPLLNCGREGLDVDVCEGRDWSFMQDRLAYQRATGTVDETVCRAFVAGVPPTAADPVGASGWVRCPYDDPSVWAAADCAELGIAGRTQCYVCSGLSRTHDTFTHVQAFDSDCVEATVTYGANVPPVAIDRCQRSTDRHDCSTAVWGRP